MCVFLCVFWKCVKSMQMPWRLEESMELPLQAVVNLSVWLLGTNPGFLEDQQMFLTIQRSL